MTGAGKRIAVLSACLWLGAAPAAALAACPQTTLSRIESRVMCPVCGVPLALATEAPQAQRERAFILDLVEQCKSEQQILDALVAEYGQGVLALPSATGIGAAAYTVPILAAVLATALLVFIAIRWRMGREAPGEMLDEAPPNAGPGDAERPEAEEAASIEDAARLDADLRRYDL